MDSSLVLEKIKRCAILPKEISFDSKANRVLLEAERLEIDNVKSFYEVNKVLPVLVGYKRFDFSSFKVDFLLAFRKVFVDSKTFRVKVNFISRMPISSKSIIKRANTILKKEGLRYDGQNPDLEIYIEFEKDDRASREYLISIYKKDVNTNTTFRDDRLIVLCNPGSVIEISDFLRLSYVFKIPLVIVARQDSKFDFNLNKAKKMTKGIAYERFPLSVRQDMPSGFVLVGFSKLALTKEDELARIFKNKRKIAFVFGDEKFGLSESIRSRMDFMVKLTSEDKKPLRASHALSYVIGFERGLLRG